MLAPTRPPRRLPGRWRVVAAVAGVVIAFALGLALGQALEESPRTGRLTTGVRTIRPVPEAPTRTVTRTVFQP